MRYCILLILLLICGTARAAAPAAAESCLPSETSCILTQAVDGIDPAGVKNVQDLNLALGTAASVVLLGDDKLRQAMLDKIQKIPAGAVPQQPYIPGTTPDREKAFAEMMLMASLGRVQDVVKMVRDLKDKDESFEKGLEPQVRVVDRLAVIGKLDAAKELINATRNIEFKSEGFKNAWTWPYGPPAMLLIKAYLNEGKLQDARDVVGLLTPPNDFSWDVNGAAVQDLFARYKASKNETPAPKKSPAAAKTVNYVERDKILRLIKAGKFDQARTEFNARPDNRLTVLRNIMLTFADTTEKSPTYEWVFDFYMKGCESVYPLLQANKSRCLLQLLVDDAAKKETAISREFNAKYPDICTGSSCP